MKPFEEPLRHWMLDRVEAYLDGDLTGVERRRFEEGLVQVPDVQEELFLAKRIRAGLRGLPKPACPPHVAEAVRARIREQRRSFWAERLRRLADEGTALWQPALSMAVVVLVVVASTLVGRTPGSSPSTAEVERALTEVQWTLAYLSELGQETGRRVRQDVLEARVVDPVQEVLGLEVERPARDLRHQ